MKRPKIWVVGAFILAAISLLSSCATYATMRKDVFPAWGNALVASGPNLLKALISDIGSLLGMPFDLGEGIAGYGGPTDTVPPAQ